MQPLLLNRRARMEYLILEEMEGGLVLTGQEVKSLRLKRGNLLESFVRVVNGEAFLLNAQIQRYDFSPGKSYDPTHSRKILLHKRQVRQLEEFLQTKGFTAVPIMIGVSHNFIKVLIGIGKGKKQHERKDELKKRDLKRDEQRILRGK
jgi:SsrA-binding protein